MQAALLDHGICAIGVLVVEISFRWSRTVICVVPWHSHSITKHSTEQSRPIRSLRHHCERAASRHTVYLATSSRNRLQVLGSQSAKFAIQLTGAFTSEANHYRLLPTGSPPMGNSSMPSPSSGVLILKRMAVTSAP